MRLRIRALRGTGWILAAALSSCSAPPASAAQVEAPRVAAPKREGASRVERAVQPAPTSTSELREHVERYVADRRALERRYDLSWSPTRTQRLLALIAEHAAELARVDAAALGIEGAIDHVALEVELEHQRRELERRAALWSESSVSLGFEAAVRELHEAWRRGERPDAQRAGAALEQLRSDIASARKALEAQLKDTTAAQPNRSHGLRAVELLRELRAALREWFEFHDDYDPLFSWWCAKPYAAAREALEDYSKFVRSRVVGAAEGADDPIVGEPLGAQALERHLEHERIPYSPQELIALAEREMRWCDERLLAASRALGCGDDWRAAFDKVRALHVEPGAQPALVRELADEAVEFLEARELLTIPALAKEVWRAEMMSPARQKVNPFFLGGETVTISFPSASMEHADKLNSLRANNRHFSRAVVHHELIPGHHLQGFMTERYQPHRAAFETPFWTEGWALYWEMRLWDLGFARGPEDELGMLFWRRHRCGRVLFSLRFHSGEWNAQQCIDYLVDAVGHERWTAEGEVRRSFNGDYSPLYQAAYLIGGLQFRALHAELVASGRMSERTFHDGVLQGGNMPLDFVRARLVGERPQRDPKSAWKFAEHLR